MNAEVEIAIALGAAIAQAMDLCRAHYITPEQTIMGLQARSWAFGIFTTSRALEPNTRSPASCTEPSSSLRPRG